RVPGDIMALAPPGSKKLGPIVHQLCEFQIWAAETEAQNEGGEASHEASKRRQKEAALRRLPLGARKPKDPKRQTTDTGPGPSQIVGSDASKNAVTLGYAALQRKDPEHCSRNGEPARQGR